MSFLAINWLAVVIAAIAAFIVGGVWYSALFRVPFMAATAAPTGAGGQPATPLPRLLAMNFVGNLVLAIVLSAVIHSVGAVGFTGGVGIGFFVWVGFVATVLTVSYSFANRPRVLTLIDGGHWLVVLLVAGAIIGMFG